MTEGKNSAFRPMRCLREWMFAHGNVPDHTGCRVTRPLLSQDSPSAYNDLISRSNHRAPPRVGPLDERIYSRTRVRGAVTAPVPPRIFGASERPMPIAKPGLYPKLLVNPPT